LSPAWLLAFAYICGLVNHANSANQNAKFSTEAPFLQRFLPIAAIAATYEKQAAEGSVILPEEEYPATTIGG